MNTKLTREEILELLREDHADKTTTLLEMWSESKKDYIPFEILDDYGAYDIVRSLTDNPYPDMLEVEDNVGGIFTDWPSNSLGTVIAGNDDWEYRLGVSDRRLVEVSAEHSVEGWTCDDCDETCRPADDRERYRLRQVCAGPFSEKFIDYVVERLESAELPNAANVVGDVRHLNVDNPEDIHPEKDGEGLREGSLLTYYVAPFESYRVYRRREHGWMKDERDYCDFADLAGEVLMSIW